jgi:hypothetical protein
MEEKLDFSRNKTQELSLENLARTYIENYPNGEPVGGIYHYMLISALLGRIKRVGLKPEVMQITAADNRDRMRPGVTIFKEMEEKYGAGSFESHALRRVYAIIRVQDFADKDTDYNCAISYHQKGISVGFGPQVRVCSNMMIMGARYFLSTTSLGGIMGKQENVKNVTELITKCDEVLEGFSESVVTWREQLERLRGITLTVDQCRIIFSRLMEERIMYDTTDKALHKTTIYPLNDTCIKAAYERYMAHLAQTPEKVINAWGFYNILNEDLKPSKVDMPVLQPQMVRLNDFLMKELERL